jgi:hypothetical protein
LNAFPWQGWFPPYIWYSNARLFERGDINLHAILYIRFGKVPFWKDRIELRRDVGCPRIVKRVPVPLFAQRWMKVVQKGHALTSLTLSGCEQWLFSALPNTRISTAMEDSDDFHPIGVYAVEHAKGKTRHDCLADVTNHDAVHKRIDPNPVKDSLHSRQEINTEPRLPCFVEIEGLIKLGLSLVAQDDWKSH